MLNRVVLPAPFGPMIPVISPDATEKETSCKAVRPPNILVIPSILSTLKKSPLTPLFQRGKLEMSKLQPPLLKEGD
jgi:hypothetical protein